MTQRGKDFAVGTLHPDPRTHIKVEVRAVSTKLPSDCYTHTVDTYSHIHFMFTYKKQQWIQFIFLKRKKNNQRSYCLRLLSHYCQ